MIQPNVCFCALAISGVLSSAAFAAGYNEGISGDLSNNALAPTIVNLGPGVTTVVGSVNGSTDFQDWVAVVVPAGFQLDTYTLASYQSTDQQGFTGMQFGPTFPGNPFDAASYAGYAHFGTGAQNGALPPVNLVGQNLFPIMTDPSLAPGSTGFTTPLGAGTYTFIIQQLGAQTDYEFDFGVSPVPAPAPLGLAVLGTLAAAGRRRRRR
jgi:hypothetical protein